MYTEIEAKLKVDSLGKLEEKLAQLGAEFVEEQVHRDYYFDDAEGCLKKSDCCLRLRRMLVDGHERVFFTYKGARETGPFKKRQEIESEAAEAEPVEKLFAALGYKKDLVFEKVRRVWQFEEYECEICLDKLPLLGSFVEIEGSYDDEVADVQKKLGLADLTHIPDGYATLMERKLCQLGSDQREILL